MKQYTLIEALHCIAFITKVMPEAITAISYKDGSKRKFNYTVLNVNLYIELSPEIETHPLVIKGVSIGDKFVHSSDSRTKRISTVIDFYEVRSITTNRLHNYICIAEKEFLGQKMTFETPFATVVRNKV